MGLMVSRYLESCDYQLPIYQNDENNLNTYNKPLYSSDNYIYSLLLI